MRMRFELLQNNMTFAALGSLFWPALAQAQTPLAVPPDDGGYLQWAVAGGIGVMVVVSAFLNPKRSHLN